MTVGMYEAKAKLPELARRAQGGEEVIITHRGKPLVRLQPIRTAVDPAEWAEAVASLGRRFGVRATPTEVKEWVDEGRP
ncbi:MAG TPA: type II toxin-antitoxin system prevent-host-death family antitoxin [Armatimonadota bacterium]|jgi:prevent-host-death family protein